jgi:hypothetical protein
MVVRKTKTDRRDARHLRDLLKDDRFPGVWIPDPMTRDLRTHQTSAPTRSHSDDGQKRSARDRSELAARSRPFPVVASGPGPIASARAAASHVPAPGRQSRTVALAERPYRRPRSPGGHRGSGRSGRPPPHDSSRRLERLPALWVNARKPRLLGHCSLTTMTRTLLRLMTSRRVGPGRSGGPVRLEKALSHGVALSRDARSPKTLRIPHPTPPKPGPTRAGWSVRVFTGLIG